ncbi:MAG: leucyl aminopeptidase family protein [Proteobacteria bacterium]|nr:leucyl aminopeptidase family protein [Pseudomonadota bacterium]
MLSCYTTEANALIPITILLPEQYRDWLKEQSLSIQNWLNSLSYSGEPGSLALLPSVEGQLQRVLISVKSREDFWALADLSTRLPLGNYTIDGSAIDINSAAIAWGLNAYIFQRYKKSEKKIATLYLPKTCDAVSVDHFVNTIYWIRDLINTPTENMGPEELAKEAKNLAKQFKANFREIVGDDLLKQNYPAIHAVGRASTRAPRLVELRWGSSHARKVTLVGKGVCFDTGGLNIKLNSGMNLMKKDMGGAAHVLGLAKLIMAFQLPIQLRVLIPLVENSISGNAYRPGDIIPTRKGISVEIGNTDAEGRVILSDALTAACEENPDLIIDFATLTGAARVALGTDLPALFCNQEKLATDLLTYSAKTQDPLWRMPLFAPYRELIDSPLANISNSGSSSYAGAITAALFLQDFINPDIPWAHLDLMAWNVRTRPGRPEGGEAMALRAVFEYLRLSS